jgi:hypothetical protein
MAVPKEISELREHFIATAKLTGPVIITKYNCAGNSSIPFSRPSAGTWKTPPVMQMLALHKKFAAANTDHEKTNFQRQIDAADRQIDRLVYELYELTDDEIRIVEGAH